MILSERGAHIFQGDKTEGEKAQYSWRQIQNRQASKVLPEKEKSCLPREEKQFQG